MIFKGGEILALDSQRYSTFSLGQYKVYFNGFIFTPGKKQGLESVIFAAEQILEGKSIPFDLIYGNYFVAIVDESANETIVFTDNSGIYKLYLHQDLIATSLFDLIDNANVSIENLNLPAVNDFLHFGFSYEKETLFSGISRTSGEQFYTLKNDSVEVADKMLKGFDEKPTTNFQDFYKSFCNAVNDKVSLDLTGGTDSRLNVSMFSFYGKEFETAISGREANKDVKIGRKIANRLGVKYHLLIHDSGTVESDLKQIFQLSEGQLDVVDYHRNFQLNADRLDRKVVLQVSGAGGELYKDFWWLQDFPFYNKKHPRLSRLYDFRIESIRFNHNILANELREFSKRTKIETLKKFNKHQQSSNTITYDKIYLEYKMKTHAGVFITVANQMLNSYVPLLERDLVRIGYQLPRGKRFFNLFLRSLITRFGKPVSGFRTTDMMTCSSGPINLAVDFILYFMDKGKRLFKQILRKLVNRTYMQESPQDSDLYKNVRSLELSANMITVLKEKNILAPDIKMDEISDNVLGRLITLGMLLKRTEKENT